MNSSTPMYKPFLAPYKEVEKYIQKIYHSNIVTNNGPLVRELEEKLKEHLNVKHLFITGNATIGLQIAINALDIQNSEIINSAFSYVAAPSAIVSNNCRNIFADIDPDTFCINSNDIENKISSKTKAILPTHIFNTVCEVEKIKKIAEKNNLKVIYDAAHSFGINYKEQSIFNYGDISVCSLHAYKVLNMIEGGFIVTHDDDIAEKVFEARYFGADKGNLSFNRIGYNGKNSEMHAAIGLANLKYSSILMERRKEIYELYQTELKGYPLVWQKIDNKVQTNYSYLPIKFENEAILLQVQNDLIQKNIYCKRYFYPSLNENSFYGSCTSMPKSESLSSRILCFPLYYSLSDDEIKLICSLIRKTLDQN